ncbi:MAG TPA: hypothetical protein VKA80_09620 [Beijerinckiaceae bacterium]|nr:hypothetical protein [Beijerinckiaceae bacterium]
MLRGREALEGGLEIALRVETKIYAGEIANWREIGGRDLRIRVVIREEVDSTLGVFRETLAGWKGLRFLERSKLATTTQEAIDTVQTVEFGPYSSTSRSASRCSPSTATSRPRRITRAR